MHSPTLLTCLLIPALSVFVLSLPAAHAETKAKLTSYAADSPKRDQLIDTWGDTDADDNSKIRSAGSTWAFFHNTADPDSFRRGKNSIIRQTETGAKLHSNGDIEVTINYAGVSDTRIVANINVITDVLTEGAIADASGKPTLLTISNSKYFCVLDGSSC